MKVNTPLSIFLLKLVPTIQGSDNDPERVPDWLCPADRERYLKMRGISRRAEFLAGRRLLAYALRRCYGEADAGWSLDAPADSPPRLRKGRASAPPPSISLSHSSGLIACAVADVPRLGIDVESRRRRLGDMADVAQATLHASELAEMASLAADERRLFFLRRWTLKEALAKALGSGIALPFREFGFASHHLVESPAGWEPGVEPWGFANLSEGPDAVLGLAWTTRCTEDTVTVRMYAVEQSGPGLLVEGNWRTEIAP